MRTATGETIRQLREAAGLGRRELAKVADISQVFLGKVEQGERRPSPQTLVKIARALGLSVSELVAKIAVFEASAAPTKDEMHRGLLRAAAIAGGAALVPGLTVTVGTAVAAWLRQRAERPVGDELSFDAEALRRELVAKVEGMTADQLTILAALIEDIGVSSESSS